MRRFFLIGSLLLGAAVGFGCSDDDNPPPKADTGVDGPSTDGPGADGPGKDGTAPSCPAPATLTQTGFCLLDTADITSDYTMDAARKWAISGPVRFGKSDASVNVTLTIEKGTTIVGIKKSGGAKTFLVIERGSKIMAEGTKDAPIVFTSGQPVGSRTKGDWGGVVINGRASSNKCPATGACDITAEAQQGIYGGDKDDDNSGVLRYVRIEFAGEQIDTENEFNGLTLNGVGSGTTIEYFQGHRNADDCVEFFGGTVNAKYILCTGTGDDNLDWTDGWRGKAQFVVAHQYASTGEEDANGIEGDNQSSDNSATPRSSPVISHVTLIGIDQATKSKLGMRLRRGTEAKIWNAIVEDFNEACVQLDSPDTYANTYSGGALNGKLEIKYSLFKCTTPFKKCGNSCTAATDFTVQEWFEDAQGAEANKQVTASSITSNSETTPDFKPKGDAMTGGVAPSDAFFTAAAFRGGVDPANDWTTGWTTFVEN
jgi:hypothetical protein